MDAGIEINDAAVQAALLNLRQLGRGQRTGVMESIARYMLTASQLRFRQQAGPEGKAWPPSKRAKAEGGQTLRDTGRLRNSLTWSATPSQAVVGTNLVYAAVHQFGIRQMVNVSPHRRTTTSTRRGGGVSVKRSPVKGHTRMMFLPARPYLGFSNADRAHIAEMLVEAVRRLAAGGSA